MTPRLYIISFFLAQTISYTCLFYAKIFKKYVFGFLEKQLFYIFLLYYWLSQDTVAQAYNSSTLKTGGRRS